MFFRGKRGQITVFVLLAIVILFAFMFLFFMKVYVEKQRFSVMATQQVQDYINQNSLSIYVTSCIDSVTTEAVIRASLQGGVLNFTDKIYGSDYITYYNPEYNRTVNISIAETPNDNCAIVYDYPPEYPYPDTFLYPAYMLQSIYDTDPSTCKYSGSVYDYYSGFFGSNRLLRLCNWNGTNKIGATNTSYGVRTCEPGTYSNRKVSSVQQEMEHFIQEEIQNCINFTGVLKTSTSNITQAGSPKAFVTWGDNGFNVRLQYPFTVTVRGRQPITAFYDFSTEEPIRFKETYDYAYYSIMNDAREAGFDITDNTLANNYGYKVKKIRSVDTAHDDIVQVVDNSTQIEGRPMIFQFAIKNRRPALDYINDYSGLLGVDLVLAENESIKITPQGYDPDEDSITYDYHLWKEDYDSTFNTSDSGCTDHPTIEYLKEHCEIKDYTKQPHNFTQSATFLATGKDAEYIPNESDRGYHELNVSVKEDGRQGLMDWQVVKIFVFDKPKANITLNNLYSDIPNNTASVEDPYILNGTNSLVGLSGSISGIDNDFSTFEWIDLLGEFDRIVEITTDRDKLLYLPIDVNGIGTDNITDIKRYVFNRTGLRNISLTVNTILGLSDTERVEVNVTQCLPHRSTDDPYPYNLSDGYQADHACCASSYTLMGTGTQCFDDVKYGADVMFNLAANDFWTRQPLPPQNSKIITYDYSGTGGLHDNDVFMRTFSRDCNGISGNLCGGNGSEIRKVVDACNDNNGGTGGGNRCSGPPANNYYYSFAVSDGPLSCASNYPAGVTFELIKKRSQSITPSLSDYFCNNEQRCTNGANYFTSGRYLCKGACSGNGECTTAVQCACASGSAPNGCGADPVCDGVPSGQTPNKDVCDGGAKTYFADKCSSCVRVDRGDNICYGTSLSTTCTAPIACDGRPVYGAVLANNYEFCNNTCQPQPCPNNYAYSGTACYTSCTDNSQCRDGYACCTQEMIDNNECSMLGCFNTIGVIGG